jgi:hypothetical protein
MELQIYKGKITKIGSGLTSLGSQTHNSSIEHGYLEISDGSIIKKLTVVGMLFNDKLSDAFKNEGEVEIHVGWANKKRETAILLSIKNDEGKSYTPDLSIFNSVIFMNKLRAVGYGVFGIPMLFAGGLGLLRFWLSWIYWKETTILKSYITYSADISNAIVC